MNLERLRKIIAYSEKNHEDIYSMVNRFCDEKNKSQKKRGEDNFI